MRSAQSIIWAALVVATSLSAYSAERIPTAAEAVIVRPDKSGPSVGQRAVLAGWLQSAGMGALGGAAHPGRADALNYFTTPGEHAVAVSGDYGHTCVLTKVGGVECWGWNRYGQLGDGTTTDRLTPVVVEALGSGVTAIAVGDYHTCALTGSGGVECWGGNGHGQLGDGTGADRHTPDFVKGLESGVAAIAAGGDHTCALIEAGGIECWGANRQGQLGDGTTTDRHKPVFVTGLRSAAAIAAGQYHTCASMVAGGLKCWGFNRYGQVGGGGFVDYVPTPVSVPGFSSVTAISPGYFHTCAVTAAGRGKCWGYNYYGELGDGTTTDRHSPVSVKGLSSVKSIAAARGDHTCALTDAGGVECWGSNHYGQLGDGTTKDRHTAVFVRRLASGVAAISAGGNHTCAVTVAGGVRCWGWNHLGQLGDGTMIDRHTPVHVLGF